MYDVNRCKIYIGIGFYILLIYMYPSSWDNASVQVISS